MFKAGDKVICIEAFKPLILGQEYIVDTASPYAVWVEGIHHGWNQQRFKKVDEMTIEINPKAKSKKTNKTQANIFYVRRVGTVTEKVVHKTFEDARNEANRLAELTPDHEFQVLAVAYTVKKVPVYTTEAQEYGV